MYKLFLILGVLLYTHSSACTCIGTSTITERFNNADVILSGKVIKIDTTSFSDYTLSDVTHFWQKVSLLVFKYYKGELQKDTVIVESGIGKGECGATFKLNKTYIVFFYIHPERKDVHPERYVTTICEKNRIYNNKDNRTLLKLSRKQNQ